MIIIYVGGQGRWCRKNKDHENGEGMLLVSPTVKLLLFCTYMYNQAQWWHTGIKLALGLNRMDQVQFRPYRKDWVLITHYSDSWPSLINKRFLTLWL